MDPSSIEIDGIVANATAHLRSGRLREADGLFREALRRSPQHASALHGLGQVARRVGQLQPAAELFRRAVQADSSCIDGWLDLGNALLDLRQFDPALAAFRRAIELRPDRLEAYHHIGRAFKEAGRLDEAADWLRRTLEIHPQFAAAHSLLGNVLRDLDRSDEAIEQYQQAIALQPEVAMYHANLAIARQERHEFDAALAGFDKALELDATDLKTLWQRGCLRLLLGDFTRGWPENEARWGTMLPPPKLPRPLWDGSDLSGRTIFVYGESGLGDTIQFARYAPLLTQRGARVVLGCKPALRGLLGTLEGVAEFVADGGSLPAFDMHRPLMSLPLVLGTTLDNVPAEVPYLKPDAMKVEQWRQRFAAEGSSFKVGLVWAGNTAHQNDRRRSIPLASLAPLADVPGVRFYALQKGQPADQPAPPGLNLIRLSPELNDFTDTAAVMANLDLVLTVDTSVAHVAGALARPTWTLLPFFPDWRWLIDRQDSPWYPTMRLFRQPRPGDWATVIHQVTDELAKSAT